MSGAGSLNTAARKNYPSFLDVTRALGSPAAKLSLVGKGPSPRRAEAQSQWYVAQVLSQKEGYAAEHLGRQGFQTFVPRFYKTRRHARKSETVLAPLFPGYIFVRFDIKMDRWLSVNSTRGVLRLVGPRQSAPQPVPARVIEHLRARCRAGVLTKISDSIKPGDRIQINAGPLAGQMATIQALNDQRRVSVLLSLLGAEHSVLVNADQLAPAAVA
jgi:transcriptional antiterminator RfaH